MTHDFSAARRGYGHDFGLDQVDGNTIKLHGWCYGIEPGDFLILGLSWTRTTRYQVLSVEYTNNVPDMWFATAEFAPRPAVVA